MTVRKVKPGNAAAQQRQGEKPRRHRRAETSAAAGSAVSAAQSGGKSMVPFLPYHAVKVPKEDALRMQFLNGEEPCTTVMLRNIPSSYKQKKLIEEIDKMGFEGTFDFFYLPMDLYNGLNVGYAFINFVTSVHASRFKETFIGYKFKLSSSGKIANVSLAHIQGLVNNLMHFADRAVALSKDIQYRPVVLCQGQRRDFREVLDEIMRYDSDFAASAGGAEGPAALKEPAAPSATSLNPLAEAFVPSGLVHQAHQAEAPALIPALIECLHGASSETHLQNLSQIDCEDEHDMDAAKTTFSCGFAADEPPDAFANARKAFEDVVAALLMEERQDAAKGQACDSGDANDTNTCTPRSSCASVTSDDSCRQTAKPAPLPHAGC